MIVILITTLAIVLQLTAVTQAVKQEGKFQLCFENLSKVSKSFTFTPHLTIRARKCMKRSLPSYRAENLSRGLTAHQVSFAKSETVQNSF